MGCEIMARVIEMRQFAVLVFSTLVSIIAASCTGTPQQTVSVDLENYYKSNPTPPSGMARIYVLPAHLGTWLQDTDTFATIFAERKNGNSIRIASVSKHKFAAFDVAPGDIIISATGPNSNSSKMLFSLRDRQTVFLYPQLAVNRFIPIAAIFDSVLQTEFRGGDPPPFDALDLDQGMKRINELSMSGLYPEARALVRQEISPSSGVWSAGAERGKVVAPQSPPRQIPTSVRFSEAPLTFNYQKPRRDTANDIAVIIGNADYSKGHDIPNAITAYADAESMRRYAIDGLGVREGNVIFIKDATNGQLVEIFGNERDHRGKLFNWVKPGKSRVFVYYIGHGAPGNADGRAMLVPSDASAAQIALSGYPLDLLYTNLGRVPAEQVTVVLEACFSGTSPAGSVLGKSLPISVVPKSASVPTNVTVISAAAADQMANWEQDDSHAIFTKYFLKGMSGEADKAPYGNGDGMVSLDELDRYLKETMTYMVRRTYGRDQMAQIVRGGS